MNRRYGLKIWSINTDWIDDIIADKDKGFFSYIELFAVPHTFKDTSASWQKIKSAGISVQIHGAHSTFKVNWADKDSASFNRNEAEDSFRFADMFNSEIIIFHPGYNGTVEESIRQLGSFKDNRIVIENKPFGTTDDDSLRFRGSTPEELKLLLDGTGYGCCIDVAHAICSANSHKTDGYDYFDTFLKLPYRICHISDGKIKGTKDMHASIGSVEYDFKRIMKSITRDVYITLETPKKLLADFNRDITYLRTNT